MTMTNSTYIELKKINKRFLGDSDFLFKDFCLKLDHKVTALLGPNGCGKTTLVRMVAGLEPYSGEISFDFSNLNGKKRPERVGYAFQDPTSFLFPWLTGKDNIAFPLKVRGVNKEERGKKVDQFLRRFEFNFSFEAYPYQLSLGQRQILVVLRALVDNPNLLFLDEAFSSLDYFNRTRFLIEIINQFYNRKIVILFVSHTIDEAILVGDELVLFGAKPIRIIDRIPIEIDKGRRNYKFLTSKTFLEIKNQVLVSLQKCLPENIG